MNETPSKQRVAILTGAARGIGAAMARLFTERGYAVTALDVLESGRAVCEEITSSGGVCQFYSWECHRRISGQGNGGRGLQPLRARRCPAQQRGYCAGQASGRDRLGRISACNQREPGRNLSHVQHVLPIMRNQHRGSIVNMASVSGHVGQTEHALYGATKGAVLSFTRALAWEVAKDTIRVNSISPGSVRYAYAAFGCHAEITAQVAHSRNSNACAKRNRPSIAGPTHAKSLRPPISWQATQHRS